MNIKLYSFSKKENSTSRPSASSGTSYTCILKDDCSIINPIITFDFGLVTDPSSYNYAYIEDFGRYYFINNWVFGKRVWTAYLLVDVLASWKTQIGNLEKFVIRSSHSRNGNVIDTIPVKLTGVSTEVSYVNTSSIKGSDYYRTAPSTEYNFPNFWSTDIDQGYVIISITSTRADVGLQYIYMTYSAFTDFVSRLVEFVPSDMTDISEGIARQIYDPLQYINNVWWIPGLPCEISSTQKTLYVGPTFNYLTFYKDVTNMIPLYEGTFTISKHPQSATRGDYLNVSNITTKRRINIPPFGSFDLPVELVRGTSIKFNIALDIHSNIAHLTLIADNKLLGDADTEFGAPLNLAQVTADVSVGNIVKGSTSEIFRKWFDPRQIIDSDRRDSYFNATSGVQVDGNMSIGNIIGFSRAVLDPYVASQFVTISDLDSDSNGYALCQVETLSDIPGFILCDNGDISIPATKQEILDIKRYLTTGMYYE